MTLNMIDDRPFLFVSWNDWDHSPTPVGTMTLLRLAEHPNPVRQTSTRQKVLELPYIPCILAIAEVNVYIQFLCS